MRAVLARLSSLPWDATALASASRPALPRYVSSSSSSPNALKSFVPAWMKRGQEEEELSPAELLGQPPPTTALAPTREPRVSLEYRVPADLTERLSDIWFRVGGAVERVEETEMEFKETRIDGDEETRFRFLDACVAELGKPVLGCDIDFLITLEDARRFFSRQVLPKDKFLNRMLEDPGRPANLHVIPEYMTYEKEMELHHGRDVYPFQDIIVTSLSERGKYRSVRKPKSPWQEAMGFNLPTRNRRHPGY